MPTYRKSYYGRGAYGRRHYGGGGAYGRTRYGGGGRYRRSGGYIQDGLTGLGKQGGQFLGKALGRVIEKFTGLGAYKRRGAYTRSGAYKKKVYKGHGSYDEVQQGMIAPMPPGFETTKGGNWVEVCHREYIGDVYSSATPGALQVNSFYINPSDLLTFPQISQMAAALFQQYKFMGCIFEFKSFSADALNSTNTALGTVVAAVNYDSTDPIPTTRAQMENTDWSQAFKPSNSFIVPVECDRKETFGGGLLYTRQSSNIPSGEDRRLYDLARLDIATVGVQGASVNLGSLYVTYKLRLFKIIQYPPLILAGLYHTYTSTGVLNSAPLGTAGSDTTFRNNIGIQHTSGTVLTLPLAQCIPNAVYRLDAVWSGNTATVVSPGVTASGSVAMVGGYGPTNATTNYNNSNTTATILIQTYFFQVSATPTANGVLTFGTGGTVPAGSSVLDLQITQMSGIWNQNI